MSKKLNCPADTCWSSWRKERAFIFCLRWVSALNIPNKMGGFPSARIDLLGFFSLYSQNSWMYASGLYHQVWEGRKKMLITREDWPKWVSVFSQWTLHIKILSLLSRVKWRHTQGNGPRINIRRVSTDASHILNIFGCAFEAPWKLKDKI